jgi:hypothetical protein
MVQDTDALDPFLQTYLRRVPEKVAASFNDEQLAALKVMFGARAVGQHGIEFRRTFRLFGRAFYLCVLGGSCRRQRRAR